MVYRRILQAVQVENSARKFFFEFRVITQIKHYSIYLEMSSTEIRTLILHPLNGNY